MLVILVMMIVVFILGGSDNGECVNFDGGGSHVGSNGNQYSMVVILVMTVVVFLVIGYW